MPTPPDILAPLNPNSPFTEVLYRRRAVRAYKADVIEEHRLKKLLDAAVHAPTARHQEPWQFVVVQNRELLKRISDRAKELARANAAHHGNVLKPPGSPGDGVVSPLADPDFNIFYDAGTLVVICARLTPEFFSPDSWPAHSFVVADCWLAAVREFKKAVELDPTDGALRREYGELLRDLPVYPEAEKEARKAVELSPNSAGAHRLLGQVLLATAKDNVRLEEAASQLKAANEMTPSDPQGAVAYAQVLLRLEKPKEASAVLEGVLDRANGPAILLLYGETLERSNQLPQAEEVYKGLLKLDPENRAALLGLLRVYDRGRQFDKAAPILQSFLKQQPGNLGLKTQYGGLLLRGRRFAEARKIFEEVLAGAPGNREALRLYAALLSETREPDKADEALRKLQALEPDDLEIPYRRAMNFLEARRIPEAEA